MSVSIHRKASITSLSLDCMREIFSHLSSTDIKTLMQVSKIWHEESFMSKYLCKKDYSRFQKPDRLCWNQFYRVMVATHYVNKIDIKNNMLISACGSQIQIYKEFQTPFYINYEFINKESTHKNPIKCFSTYKLGTMLNIVTADINTIKKWKFLHNKVIEYGSIKTHQMAISTITACSNLILSGSFNGSVAIWIHNNKNDKINHLRTLYFHTGCVNFIKVDKEYNPSIIFTAGEDGYINVIKINKDEFELCQAIYAFGNSISSLKYSNEFDLLVSSSGRTLKIWKKNIDNVFFKQCSEINKAHKYQITDVCIDKISESIISSSYGKIKFWKIKKIDKKTLYIKWKCDNEMKFKKNNVSYIGYNLDNPTFNDKNKVYILANEKLNIFLSKKQLGYSRMKENIYQNDLRNQMF